ncbi:MAG: hypothetical protein A2259_01030 [Candidatus Moranbacteria bacterium RIFOXYA2_FULL_43_15]|nr:MAG: hypothetical protein A2259_01030 [Candidatus Moranbacteria bacterium RIFOXYA2_FULL_43_15]
MDNKKKYILFAALAAIAVVAGYGFWNNSSPDSQVEGESVEAVRDDSKIIFFYGQECPHCKIVEDYFRKNGVSEKIEFSQREVYHSKPNANFMLEKARACGLDEKKLGVPLLWTEEKCYIGDKEIVSYFEEQLKK